MTPGPKPGPPGTKPPAAPVEGKVDLLAWTLWEPQRASKGTALGVVGVAGPEGRIPGGLALLLHGSHPSESWGGLLEPAQSSEGLDLWVGKPRLRSKAKSGLSAGPPGSGYSSSGAALRIGWEKPGAPWDTPTLSQLGQSVENSGLPEGVASMGKGKEAGTLHVWGRGR